MIRPEHFDAELGALVRDPQYADLRVYQLLNIHEALISERLNADEEYKDIKCRIVAAMVMLIIVILGGSVLWATLSRS